MGKIKSYTSIKNKFWYPLIVTLLIITIPGFLSTFDFATSHRNGVLISLFLIFLFMLKSLIYVNKKFINISIIFVIIISITTLINICLINYQPDTFKTSMIRFLGSILILSLVILSAIFFENYLDTLDDHHFKKLISSIYNFLIFLGFVAFPFYYFDLLWKKHLFFFSEPSHYSISLAPFFFYKIFVSKIKFIHITSLILLGLMWGSFTLLVVSLSGVLLVYNLRKNILVNFLIIIILIISVLYLKEKFQFVSDRLYFSTDTNNLSLLSFFSGYERAYLSFFESYGIGMGLQQMGVIGPLGEIQEKIRLIIGDYMNIYDGSSLAPKIIFEFGITGIFVILIYLYYFGKNLIKLRSNSLKSEKELFFSLVFISLIIILFGRSASYFTPSMFIFTVGLVGINKTRKY